jgi:hypothetical protein
MNKNPWILIVAGSVAGDPGATAPVAFLFSIAPELTVKKL